ncbi:hypothetical protein L218DRAFT_945057 [Marasmius fiardii PR-910]|nr:hypothetical protein L218DRAFT_945057 [Marasmius fiardii PR-910]
MFARKLFAVFTFILFGLVASATLTAPHPPVDIVERDDPSADIWQTLMTLKASTDVILPQIRQLAANPGMASDAIVTPLMEQLISDLNQAASALSTAKSSATLKRQSEGDIANLIAAIVKDITTATSGLLPGGINAALTQLSSSLVQIILFGNNTVDTGV